MTSVQELPSYIVVEGVIGVGKTTLVHELSSLWNARHFLEEFDDNPFLAAFYEDQVKHAFATEMFFLIQRFNQQELFSQQDLLQRIAVSDYLFDKSRIFAGLTLAEHELVLFDRVYQILRPQVPAPDLVVYLHAPIENILGRIAQRGRSYEEGIPAEYLESIDSAYRRHLAALAPTQLIQVNTQRVDFRRPEKVRRLAELIEEGARGDLTSYLATPPILH
jgi:deoxyadenosine/deoxycytidine kinase